MDEFLDLIEKDAVGSRAEPGCIRFDVHQSQDDPNKFFFYEVYVDADAVAFHKEQPHFALWTNFKESGGVVSSVSHKLDGIFMT
jgi:quinol monooxygenase YgiN